MTIQDQYIETFRQTQETWADVVKSFTNDAQRTFGHAVLAVHPRRSQRDDRPGLRLLGEVPRSSAQRRQATGWREHLGRREGSRAGGVGERRGAPER